MSDLISRQAVIDAVEKESQVDGAYGYMDTKSIVDLLSDLPSAEPKKGRWIRNNNGTHSCSVCQSWIPEEQHYYARYCLYCGTKMEVAE